jgi:hypothetical protein
MMSSHKNKNNQIRRLKETIFNKANHLGLQGPKIYVLIENSGNYDIFNSLPDEKWVPTDKILVFFTSKSLRVSFTQRQKEHYYPIPKQSTPDDILQRVRRKTERLRAKLE